MPIDLEEAIQRKRDATFEFYGKECRITYLVEKMTREFRAELLRLSRASLRLEQRQKELGARITAVEHQPGTPEADAEDVAAEAAIKQLEAEDAVVKRQIDEAIYEVLASWDMTLGGKPAPITMEVLDRTPSELEGAIIGAILTAADPKAKASAPQNMKPLPYTLKPKAKRVRSPHRRIG